MGRKILIVDDEPNVLEALGRTLRGRYEVHAAQGGEVALEILRERGPFEVILSDMRMPGMNGVQFLEKAKSACPNAVRMMLTGDADQQTAAAAINEGAIFRFLCKPASSESLIATIEACATQHDLLTAERDLLENTLSGAVRVLIDILSIVHPESFGRALTLKTRAGEIARHLRLEQVWAVELAALFSRIGAVVVPPMVLMKARQDGALNAYERRLLGRIPALGADLLAQIPRLGKIAEILRHQDASFAPATVEEGSPLGAEIPVGSRLLKVLNDLADLEERGLNPGRAMFVLRRRRGVYDPEVLGAVQELLAAADADRCGYPLGFDDLKVGMKLKADLSDVDGKLLVCAGATVSQPLLERLQALHAFSPLAEPIMVESLR